MTMVAFDEVRTRSVWRPCGARLAVTEAGPAHGAPIILLHGVTGTGDAVVRPGPLEAAGHRVVRYDARGHGASGAPRDPGNYGFDALVGDLVAVMEATDAGRAVLVGASMGALTALRLALEAPKRVAALVAVTPAFDPATHPLPEALERGDRVSAALRADDRAAFVAANPIPSGDPASAALLARLLHRRLAAHRDVATVADALDVILRDRPFDTLDELRAISALTVVVGSRDELDPDHPVALAQAYAEVLAEGELAVEARGELPLAWRDRLLARLVLDVASRAAELEGITPIDRGDTP